MHLLDIVLVSCNASTKRCFKEGQEESGLHVVIQFENVLEDLGTGVQE